MPSIDTDALIAGLGMDRASQLAALEELQQKLAGRTDPLRILLRLVPLAPLSPDALDDEDVRLAMVGAYFAGRHGIDGPMAGCRCCPALWLGTLRPAVAVKLEVPGVITVTNLLCGDCADLPRAELARRFSLDPASSRARGAGRPGMTRHGFTRRLPPGGLASLQP